MVTANPPDKTEPKNVIASLLCSACGKYFRYDQCYILDPHRKAIGGGPAVFARRCYKGPETPILSKGELDKIGWKPLEPAFESDDDALVYHFVKEFPKDLAHDARKMKEDE